MTGNEPSVDRPSWFRLALTWGILGAFVIATIVYFSIKLFAPGVPVIRVGLVGPMTGPAAEQGAEMLAGAQAMLAKANGEEVLGRYRIELVVKDDQNDPERAKTLAAELADQTDVVAVLGPLTDETALAAGPVYADRKLTAVIGGSGLADVTFKNPYFFRTGLSTEIQGKLLAHYISRVLKVEKLIMIRDDSQYAESFFVAFENEISVLKRLGTVKTTIDKTFPFKAKAKSVDERIVQIAENLSVQYLGETILLITDSAQAGNVIRQLKDRPRRRLGRIIPYTFIGPDTLAQPEFRKMFAGLRRERDRPGFYAEGVHTVAPFLSDVVNKEAVGFLRNFEAQNGRQPGGVAADYYDAAKAVMEAIRRSSYATQPAAKVRTEVRDLVAAIDSSEKALDGVSGSLHFDLDGNAVKWVPIGVYRNGGLVSPQIQLVPVSTQEINDDADILQVGGQFFTRTKVIYTGVRLNEINSVDFAERRYNADVNIWFRFPGELDFSAIEFPDALEPLALGDPLSASDQDSGAYRMFHIAAPFKAEVNKEGRRELLLQLRHRDLNRNNIIFVPDIQGMATGGEGTFYDRTRLAVRLDGNTNWRVGAIRVFQDIEPVQTLGNPRYAAGDVAGFSRFNLSVGLENMESTVLDRFGFDVAIAVFLLVGIAASVVHLAALKRTRTHVRRILWLPESVLILCCLLAAEATVLGWLSTHAEGRDYLEPAITTFQVLWWMIPTWLIVQAVERFIWRPLELRTGRVVPRVVRVFAAMILYTIGGLGVVAFVFDQTVTSLLATSGVLAMILGLAIQMNLSNVFSGLAINVETPFRIGDWIKVGDYEPGEVVAITWRTTRLRTRDSNIICIPNSVASDSTVENFSYPEETYRLELMVHADPGARPQWVEKILRDAITSTAGIHKKPLPEIVFTGVQEWSAAYAVRFFVDNYPASIEVQAAAWRDIVRNMRYAGFISVIHEEFTLFHLASREGKAVDTATMLLDDVPIFEPFGANEKGLIRKRLRTLHFEPDEVIINQGDAGASLFIIAEGALIVEITVDDGSKIEVGRLGPGDFFGEMALLTGEPRTATVTAATPSMVLEIEHSHIASIIQQYPDIAEDLSLILTKRTLENLRSKQAHDSSKLDKQGSAKALLGKIMRFFEVAGPKGASPAVPPSPEKKAAPAPARDEQPPRQASAAENLQEPEPIKGEDQAIPAAQVGPAPVLPVSSPEPASGGRGVNDSGSASGDKGGLLKFKPRAPRRELEHR